MQLACRKRAIERYRSRCVARSNLGYGFREVTSLAALAAVADWTQPWSWPSPRRPAGGRCNWKAATPPVCWRSCPSTKYAHMNPRCRRPWAQRSRGYSRCSHRDADRAGVGL